MVGATGESDDVAIAECERATGPTNGPGEFMREHHGVGTEFESEAMLGGVLRHRHDRAGASEASECGDGEQAERT
ncbi:unannotated protein [freshwater metagenome]|uniref:Unannotated protein n=1 Tax=freshwater metagenome TaxID=449393 RepID=A0A6J7IAN3_9ZZZZ